MLTLNTKHFLTGEELSLEELLALLEAAQLLKQQRQKGELTNYLVGKHLALLFNKPSLRTRFSFSVGMHELGGHVVESTADMRKHEEPEDQVRVIAGYCHGLVVRTHHDSELQRMQTAADIPIINGLSALHHPCQILADLMTLKEAFSGLAGLNVCYIGDGNNILHSLMLIAPGLGINLHYCCPKSRLPQTEILQRAQLRKGKGSIRAYTDPLAAVKDCQAIYTDVWTSMGFEQTDDHLFEGFQVNTQLLAHADKNAIILHCLPMERGKEISQEIPEYPCSAIFRQSENRLHSQKALLIGLLTH